METDSLVETLENAGLSPYQAEAYTALLQLGVASARDVAAASDIPDARIYDILRDLQSRGYVELFERDTIHARPAKVTTVIRDLEQRAESLLAASEEIEERYREPALEEHTISVVERFETVVTRTVETIDEAEYHVQLSLTLDELDEFRGALKRASDRGVAIQLCLHSTTREAVSEADFPASCTEVRYRTQGAPFLATVDRTKVGYALHVGAANEYGLVVDDPANAFVLRWYYLTSLWEPATRLPDLSSNPGHYVQIRRCVHELQPRLEGESSVPVTVVGRYVDNGEPCQFSGDAIGVRPTPPEDSPATLLHFAGKAALVVESEGERITVGGFEATEEDVEARSVTVDG